MTIAPKITELIDKRDNKELVRDQIAAILLLESTQQQTLAQGAGKDPELWKLRIFTERSDPWEEFPKAVEPGQSVELSPLVNVSWDQAHADEHASSSVSQQLVVGMFNVDCYGAAISSATADGHAPGDREAAFEAQRAERLVRNILMAGPYTYLDMRGVVGRRWIDSSQAFQPTMNERPQVHVQAVRIAFRVQFLESAPQVQGVPLALLALTAVTRGENGQLNFAANYPYGV